MRATHRKMMSRAGDEHIGGVEGAAARASARASRASRTATARSRTRCRARRVALPAVAARAALRADVGLLSVAVPDRDLVAPPQLARDAPRADVLHPVEVAGAAWLGLDAHAPVVHRLDRRAGQLVHAHEPLQRDQRLDPLARAVRERDLVRVVLGGRRSAPARAARRRSPAAPRQRVRPA